MAELIAITYPNKETASNDLRTLARLRTECRGRPSRRVPACAWPPASASVSGQLHRHHLQAET
jgi:hypothetical protein